MPFDILDPGPYNGNSPFPVNQADDQQLMPKSDLGAILDQTDLTEMTELRFQLLPGDGFVPFFHSDGRSTQQSGQTPGALGENKVCTLSSR